MHKHAEVLKAIIEGKEVEWSSNNIDWSPYNYGSIFNPLCRDYLEWRVKKEPVIKVKYFKLNVDARGLIYEEFTPPLEKWDLKVTYHDGLAVKAELPNKG